MSEYERALIAQERHRISDLERQLQNLKADFLRLDIRLRAMEQADLPWRFEGTSAE